MGLWGFLTWFRTYQVCYAIKAGLAAVALASLAFIPSTQAYFKTYRMEWTLITVRKKKKGGDISPLMPLLFR
jgi:hypothetical protein